MVDEAMKMNLNFKAKAEGDRVINRREKELDRMRSGRILADHYPSLTPNIKKSLPIGKTMEETEDIFRNVWVDNYTKNVNNLCKAVAIKNKLDDVKRSMFAKDLAIAGLAVPFNESLGGEMVITYVRPEDFFFDTGAKNFDLTDAEFQGHTDYAMPTDLYEQFDISEEDKHRIEKYTKDLPIQTTGLQPTPFVYSNLPGRVPIVYVEWKDCDKKKCGYVIDQFGYEYFTRVYPNDYKPKNSDRIYYEKDLITPKSIERREFMRGKLYKIIEQECLRFCRFTPSEVFMGGNSANAKDKAGDIVYDYGVVPHQEIYILDPTTTEFSYRPICWDYQDGWISSPIDDIIDPQRLVNRYRAMAESKANKDTSGIVIDLWSLMGTNTDEAELQRKVERGETITVNSKGMGVPNAMGEYGANLHAGAQAMTELANGQVGIAAQRLGIISVPGKESKKALMGAEADEQSLHGLYLSRMVQLFKQEYQCISNKGRRIYADSPRRLAIMVGDKGSEDIRITKDMLLEDFRIDIQRADDDKMSKQQATLALTQYLQMKLITEDDLADNAGRVTMDEIPEVLRNARVRIKTAQKAQQEAQQQQQQHDNMLAQANMERMELQKKQDRGIELSEAEKDRANKLDAIILRAKMAMEKDTNKHHLKIQEMTHERKE